MIGLAATFMAFVIVIWFFRRVNKLQPVRIANRILWMLIIIVGLAMLLNVVIMLLS